MLWCSELLLLCCVVLSFSPFLSPSSVSQSRLFQSLFERDVSSSLLCKHRKVERIFPFFFLLSLLFRPVLKFAKYDTLNYNTLNYKTHSYRVSYLGNLRTREREKDITHSLKDDAL